MPLSGAAWTTPKQQPYRGNQAFAYPVADLDILDANIRGVVKQGEALQRLNVYLFLIPMEARNRQALHRFTSSPRRHT